MLVGLTWLGMIGYELSRNRIPTFLIVMVPVFALARFLIYRYYQSTGMRSTN